MAVYKVVNIALTVSYDGTGYAGFQLQENAVTVQEKLEKALFRIYKENIRVAGAGRTDSGVHARGQVVNFKAVPLIPVDKIPLAINSCLPRDISVLNARQVPDSFHSRLHAVKKTYSYNIHTGTFPDVFRRLYTWHCRFPLDVPSMQAGCRFLPGEHDFRAFQAAGSTVTDTVRTIYRAEIMEDLHARAICFLIEGSGFLYKMVRLIAGTLVTIGKGLVPPEALEEVLKGKFIRPGPALPARGLCLERVEYQEEKRQEARTKNEQST